MNACCSPRHLRSLKPTPRSQPATKAGREEGQEERDPLEWNQRTGVRKKRQEQVQVGDNDGWINPPDHLVISCEAYPVGKDGRPPPPRRRSTHIGFRRTPRDRGKSSHRAGDWEGVQAECESERPDSAISAPGMRGREKRSSRSDTAARSTKTKTHV